MKVKVAELRMAINKFLTEALAEIEQEDVDRLRRAKDGYGETEFEEDVDRLRRAADGYGETEFEEALAGPKDPSVKTNQSPQASAALHTRDKSQMQGVGPRPTMATAFGDEGDNQDQKKNPDSTFNPNKTVALSPTSPNVVAREKMKADRQASIKQISQQQQQQMAQDGWKFEKDPSGNWMAKPPRLGESEEEGQGFAPKYDGAGNVTNRPGQGFKPSYDKNGNVSNRKYTKDQMKFKDDEKVKESAAPSDKEEEFIKKNKADFKKRYGARWKEVLYATANEKFRK